MRFDKLAELIETSLISDGLGGYIESENTVVATFPISLSGLAQELTLNDYGYDSSKDLRVFTRFEELETGDKLRIDGVLYRIIRIRDYQHTSSLVVRKDG